MPAATRSMEEPSLFNSRMRSGMNHDRHDTPTATFQDAPQQPSEDPMAFADKNRTKKYQSLDVDEEQEDTLNSSTTSRRRPPTTTTTTTTTTTPKDAKRRFVLLATLAVVLTITCPGTRTTTTVVTWIKAILVYASTLISFYSLCGSNPGYVKDAADILEDGTLLDHAQDRDAAVEQTNIINSDSNNSNNDRDSSSSTYDSKNHRTAHERSMSSEVIVSTNTSFVALDESNDSNTTTTSGSVVPSSTFQGTRRRYCPTCRVSPPLRSHHCKQCDLCVATFDHHCAFVGTCIGERNHTRFWWYLLIQAVGFSILCQHVGLSRWGLSTIIVSGGNGSGDYPLWDVLRVVATKCYLYPLRFFAWTMLVFHTYMALTNTTTFELSKGSRHIDYLKGTKLCDLPFSKVNCQLFFAQQLVCGSCHISLNHLQHD